MSGNKKHWTQKLKADNLYLQQQLRELVLKPDSIRSEEIRTFVKYGDALEKSLWFGDRSGLDKLREETEIAVRDGNFFVMENERSEPRNEGQAELLKYMHTQIALGNKADNEEIIKIYFKYVMEGKGQWIADQSKGEYETQELCKLSHPAPIPMYDFYDKTFSPGYWSPYTIDHWETKQKCKAWFNRAIGSLVKNGFLIVIPKGYILQRIEESKKA